MEGLASVIMQSPTLITNYLDDFLVIYITIEGCNAIMIVLLEVCERISFLVSLDKTEWVDTKMIFLGMLMGGYHHTLSISSERHDEILHLVQKFKDAKKAMVKSLQQLAGHLNFVNRAVVLGWAFTRRMYAKFSGKMIKGKSMELKPHHHVKLDKEFRLDCLMWEQFLLDINSVIRPFIDLDETLVATEIGFYSDASANPLLGYGAIMKNKYIFGQYEHEFVSKNHPSIEFLELFALCAGIITWEEDLARTRIIVFCDNISVVSMVNKLSSSCKQCMKLIRLLTLNNLKYSRRVFIKHIEGRKNCLSDALSRLNFPNFFRLA